MNSKCLCAEEMPDRLYEALDECPTCHVNFVVDDYANAIGRVVVVAAFFVFGAWNSDDPNYPVKAVVLWSFVHVSLIACCYIAFDKLLKRIAKMPRVQRRPVFWVAVFVVFFLAGPFTMALLKD